MARKKAIIIVGAGISGLTAGTYLLRYGYNVTIIDRSSDTGGLVNSFTRQCYLFDTGPRAIGNAGALEPMLKDLGIELELIKGRVTTGIENEFVDFAMDDSIENYLNSLSKLFPGEKGSIKKLRSRIKRSCRITKILNSISNPLFINPFKDLRYTIFQLLPWLPKFIYALISSSQIKIEESLHKISNNSSFIDIVSQHFFKGTPELFALGYFESFKDYRYPLGGTRKLPDSIKSEFLKLGGEIQLNKEIVRVDPLGRTLEDRDGDTYSYDSLLWTGNLKTLYCIIKENSIPLNLKEGFLREKIRFEEGRAGESIFSVFVGVNRSPEYFMNISHGHMIYTPLTMGLGDLNKERVDRLKEKINSLSKEELYSWAEEFCKYNSYEISIPVLKDPSLAPKGKTGIEISLVVDGELFMLIKERGWYSDFKDKLTKEILNNIEKSLYKDLIRDIEFVSAASPITLYHMFGSENGAITGWLMAIKSPVPNSLGKIFSSSKTSIPNTYIAGQWSYSPSGVPISILTGRIAAGRIRREV